MDGNIYNSDCFLYNNKFCVDGVSGSYKTTRAVEWSADEARRHDGKIIIAQPTIGLLKEWEAYLRKNHPDVEVRRFDTETCEHNVYRSIVDHVKDRANDPRGQIVLVTHKAFLEVPFWCNQDRWHAIIDEVPQVDGETRLNVCTPQARAFLIDLLEVEECAQPGWLRLVIRPGKRSKLETWAKNCWKNEDRLGSRVVEEYVGSDCAIAVFQQIYQWMIARDVVVHVSRKSWMRLMVKGAAQLDFHWHRRPSCLTGWASMTVMGANFDHSVMGMIWPEIRWIRSNDIVPERSAYSEKTGRRMRFHYFASQTWTKESFKKLGQADRLSDCCVKELLPIVRDVFAGEPFGWVGNLCISDDVFERAVGEDGAPLFPNAERIPNSPYGLNCFRHLNKIIFFSALHNTPSHFTYLAELFGVQPSELRRARMYEIAHQAIMRSDARNFDSTAVVDVVVPDHDLANWCGDLFPGSRVIAHDLVGHEAQIGSATKRRGAPRKEVRLSNAEKQVRKRAKEARLRDTKNTLLVGIFGVGNSIPVSTEDAVGAVQIFTGSAPSWPVIYDQLEELWRDTRPRKDECPLINFVDFGLATGDGKFKGKANIKELAGLWLDFEDGDLLPAVLAREVLAKYELVIINSFNNGKLGWPRYHVLIPTTRHMTAEVSELIWDTVRAQIEACGYFVGKKSEFDRRKKWDPTLKFAGLDTSKRAANSFFYVPCQAKLGKDWSFFQKYAGLSRKPIDPMRQLDLVNCHDVPEVEVPAHQNPISSSLQVVRDALRLQQSAKQPKNVDTRKDEIIGQWRSASNVDGERNHAFFVFGLKLKTLGLEPYDVERILKSEAELAPHSAKRKNQVASIMNSLKGSSGTNRARQ